MIARIPRRTQSTLLLLTGLVLAAMVLDAWQTAARRAGGQAWFEGIVCEAAAPMQNAIHDTISRMEDVWDVAVRSQSLLQENERLSSRVTALEQVLALNQEAAARSDRHQALLGAYPGLAGSSHLAEVIGCSGSGWDSYLVIDRGRAEDVRQKDVAVTADGVVGQVYAVAEHTARVIPITDPASAVAARIRRSRETGILKGRGPWECDMCYLAPDADVRVGDEVLTAGTGGVYPKGLRVGLVSAVAEAPHPPEKIATVRPAAKLWRVEEVLVLRAAAGLPLAGEANPPAPRQ